MYIIIKYMSFSPHLLLVRSQLSSPKSRTNVMYRQADLFHQRKYKAMPAVPPKTAVQVSSYTRAERIMLQISFIILLVISGVPQGSILGPLLFAIFINNLPNCVSSSIPYLFTDDTKCLKVMSNPTDIQCLQHNPLFPL